jgi:quercetin dioxygenase-like cupin family protein
MPDYSQPPNKVCAAAGQRTRFQLMPFAASFLSVRSKESGEREKTMLKKIILGLSVAALVGGAAMAQDKMAPAPAAANAIKRTPLQDIDFPANYHIVTVIAEIAPNTLAGRHTHPGIDTGYVITGGGTLMVEGKPDQQLKPGDSYAIPSGVPHDVKTGPDGYKVMAIYVVEKGKAVATPAPK